MLLFDDEIMGIKMLETVSTVWSETKIICLYAAGNYLQPLAFGSS